MNEEFEYSEWALIQTLAHPVLFREFINQDDPNWSPLEEHERAWSTCTSPYIVMCCGRGVHKTTSMIEMLYYWMINDMFISGDQGLFVLVPNKAQKDPIFFRIRSACESHWLISKWVNPNSINMSEGRIDFMNKFQLLLRLTGESGKESNVIGIHTYRIWVDEAQAIPWQVWMSLQNDFKQEIPGHQMIVSGVPNGLRKGNVLYESDQLDESYVAFNISQEMMSWWNPDREYKAKVHYHSLLELSEDYKHYVLGQHGVPMFAVFDRARFLIEDFETHKIVVTQNMLDHPAIKQIGKDGKPVYNFHEVLSGPDVPKEFSHPPLIGIGYDVGFNPDPAVFTIIYEDQKAHAWRILFRVILQRVEYAIQREILTWLDTMYNFNFMGIDMGGVGKVQYQDLTSELGDYRYKKYYERLYPVEFGSYMVVAVDEEGNEKKDQTKRVAVEKLMKWVYEHKLSFSKNDDDMIEELERTKFMRTQTGEPVYRTDNDHQMAALMCAIMAYENKFGVPVLMDRPEIKPKLLMARWLVRDGANA